MENCFARESFPTEGAVSLVAARILLIAPSVGEFEPLFPEIAARVRERFALATIEALVHSLPTVVAPGIDHLRAPLFPLRRFGRDLRQTALWVAWCRRLRRRHFDAAINLDPRLSSAMLTLATNAPVRIGVAIPAHYSAGGRGPLSALYTHSLPRRGWLPALEALLGFPVEEAAEGPINNS